MMPRRGGVGGVAIAETSDDQLLTESRIWSTLNLVPSDPPIDQQLDPADQLRQHGLQVTAQRLAILRAVAGRPHTTADELAEVVRSDIGTISRQAVYDSLGALADKGLIRRIQPAGSPARFEDRVGDNHHHLICRDCGVMHDVECAAGEAPCLDVEDDHGFTIDEAEVVYWGRCSACALQPQT